MKKRVVVIVQARMGSTRLPGKVLKEILGKPLLGYVIERIQRSLLISDLIIATSTQVSDDAIAEYCTTHSVKFYRGSENDVLSRYMESATLFEADFIVRVCADSPLIDPVLIDEIIREFLLKYPSCDYLSNTISQTYPIGMNAELFSFRALQEAHINAVLPHEREHVTPYIYCHPDRFNICQKHYQSDLSNLRLTVDVPEDFELVKLIIERIYPDNPKFGLSDIVSLYNQNPKLFRINSHILQKQVCNEH